MLSDDKQILVSLSILLATVVQKTGQLRLLSVLHLSTLNCGFSPSVGSPQTQIGGGESPKVSLTSSHPSNPGALAGTSPVPQGQVFLNFIAL